MRLLILLIAILFLSACGTLQTIKANDSNITRIGRWSDTTIGSTPLVASISGGNRLRFEFTGRSLGVSFDCTPSYLDLTEDTSGSAVYTDSSGKPVTYYPEYEYRIDGGTWIRATVQTPISVSGLSAGNHTFELWTAGINIFCNKWHTLAGIRVAGVTIDDGATLSPWPTGLPKMLVIGDSIGEGMLAIYNTPPGNVGNTPSQFSGRESAFGQVSDRIGVELWDHSFGGSGFSGTGPGQVPATVTNYLYKSAGVPKSDPEFAIVLVEATNNGPNAVNLNTLLTQVKADQPTAKIFVLGALYFSNKNDCASKNSIASAGLISGVSFIDTCLWSFSATGYSHPDLPGSTAIATYLQAILLPYVQISAVPTNN